MDLLILAGHVYSHGTTTPVENVIISCKVLRTYEEHSGTETEFPELKTNSAGEFQVNLANYTSGWESGDIVQFRLNNNGLKDLIQITIGSEGKINLVMTPLESDVYDYERCLDKIGIKTSVTVGSVTERDEDYGSIKTNPTTSLEMDNDIFMSIQIEENDDHLEEQGIIDRGECNIFSKVRYNLEKNDIVEDLLTNEMWRIISKPIPFASADGNYHEHVESRGVRL